MRKGYFFLVGIVALLLSACGAPKAPDHDIVILFENDVHCALDGYTKLGALKQEMLAQTPYVSVVSAGDYVQGAALGSITKGESIIQIMNAVGYDVTTIGNHEFDYGIDQMKHLMSELKAEVVCCNFTDLNNTLLFKPYVIKQYGNVKVGFTSSTPTYFEDSKGNLIYSFHVEDCFKRIEKAAKDARAEGADYVIVLSHLGDDTEVDNSVDMIKATNGIDAVLDGHQHHIINQKISNSKGKPVILASTGTAFLRIGKLTINTQGEVSVELQGHCDDAHIENVVQLYSQSLSGKRGIALAGEHDLLDRSFQKGLNRSKPICSLCQRKGIDDEITVAVEKLDGTEVLAVDMEVGFLLEVHGHA